MKNTVRNNKENLLAFKDSSPQRVCRILHTLGGQSRPRGNLAGKGSPPG